jgi:alpha-tubulin suppressor-like RCC1 family protein
MTARSGHQETCQASRYSRRLAAGAAALCAAALAAAPLSATTAQAARRPAAAPTSGTTIWGWGQDSAGQLGRQVANGVTNVPVRASLPRGTRITSVRAGCSHTAALTAAGQVMTWGVNVSGQLGRTISGDASATPTKVTLPPGTGKITAVRAGCAFTLALTAAGQVLAWGENGNGQLGTGTAGADSSTPVRVSLPPGTTVKAISAGSDYSLAVTTTGHLLAWGSNVMGQLGTGAPSGPVAAPVPVTVLPPGTAVTAVAAGWTTSHVITRGGGVLSWGDGAGGQLGNGTMLPSSAPVPARLPAGTKITGLFAGCADTVALTAGGKVLAWGFNSRGQLGNNSTKSSSIPVSVHLPAGTKVTAISAGCQHVLARTASGRVLAWGDNASSAVGDGTTAILRRLPARVKLPAGVKVFAVASGPMALFSFAIG